MSNSIRVIESHSIEIECLNEDSYPIELLSVRWEKDGNALEIGNLYVLNFKITFEKSAKGNFH